MTYYIDESYIRALTCGTCGFEGWHTEMCAKCSLSIENIPSAYKIEVVRCENCKYSQIDRNHYDIPELICVCSGHKTRPDDFCSTGKRKENEEMTEKERAEALGMTTVEYRAHRKLDQKREYEKLVDRILDLKDEGYSNADIAIVIGKSESYVAAIIEREMR